MNSTIWGVIVGGLIASIVPVVTLCLNHSKWKREARLEYLKSERLRLENLFKENLKKFVGGMKEDAYDIQMISDIMILMPRAVFEKFNQFMLDGNRTEEKNRSAYLDLSIEMKKILNKIDEDIRNMIS